MTLLAKYTTPQASRVTETCNEMLFFNIEKDEAVFFIVLFPFILFKENGRDLNFSNSLIIHQVKTKRSHNREGGLDTRS